MTAKKPVFYSLVHSKVTREVFEYCVTLIRGRFPNNTIEILRDHIDWSATKTELSRHGLKPRHQVDYLWGSYFEPYLEEVIAPAFKRCPDLIFVPQFGYDLYSCAVEHEDCADALAAHETYVKNGLAKFGFRPPAYVFTEHVDENEKRKIRRYFHLPGQQARYLVPTLTIPEKARAIVHMIENDLVPRKESATT